MYTMHSLGMAQRPGIFEVLKENFVLCKSGPPAYLRRPETWTTVRFVLIIFLYHHYASVSAFILKSGKFAVPDHFGFFSKFVSLDLYKLHFNFINRHRPPQSTLFACSPLLYLCCCDSTFLHLNNAAWKSRLIFVTIFITFNFFFFKIVTIFRFC